MSIHTMITEYTANLHKMELRLRELDYAMRRAHNLADLYDLRHRYMVIEQMCIDTRAALHDMQSYEEEVLSHHGQNQTAKNNLRRQSR